VALLAVDPTERGKLFAELCETASSVGVVSLHLRWFAREHGLFGQSDLMGKSPTLSLSEVDEAGRRLAGRVTGESAALVLDTVHLRVVLDALVHWGEVTAVHTWFDQAARDARNLGSLLKGYRVDHVVLGDTEESKEWRFDWKPLADVLGRDQLVQRIEAGVASSDEDADRLETMEQAKRDLARWIDGGTGESGELGDDGGLDGE
jgi:hypothetical protein